MFRAGLILLLQTELQRKSWRHRLLLLSILFLLVNSQIDCIAIKFLEVLRRDVEVPVDHFKEEVLQLVQVLRWNAAHAGDVLIREVNIIVELGCY